MFSRDQNNNQAILAKTGFFVSLFSYCVFWGAEILRPGMISRYFSVHIFVITAIVFGLWWALCGAEKSAHSWRSWGVVFVSCVCASLVAWFFGDGFGGYRVLACVGAFFLPFLLWLVFLLDE